MIRSVCTCVFVFASVSLHAQAGRDFMVSTAMDFIKSDHNGYFERTQAGLEVHYFLSEKFTVNAGIEVWTRGNSSAVLGGRWYPSREAFVRLRGLIGEDDLSIGGGFAKPITEKIRFEAITDFYFSGTFAIRGGFVFLIRNRKNLP